MKRLAVFAIAAGLALAAGQASATVKLVAAENFYGGIAQAIGGPHVEVVSVLSNPDQDPHLFETSPAVARQIADARIVIMNGADYDPWLARLLKATPRPQRLVIVVAGLVHAKPGGNPHLWYDPATMPTVARALATAFAKVDPAHASDYAARLAATLASLARIEERVMALRNKWTGTPVIATEPVFGPMADALRLDMRNQSFQRATMNDTEPSASDIARFEDDLKNRKVKAMLYNKQLTDKLTERMISIAQKAGVPVVAVTETQPAGMTYRDWMLSELDSLDKALAGAAP